MAVKELNEIYGEVGRNLDNQMDENVLIPGETGTKTFGAFKFFSGIKKFLEGSAKKIIKGGLEVDSLTVSGSEIGGIIPATPITIHGSNLNTPIEIFSITLPKGVWLVSYEGYVPYASNGVPNCTITLDNIIFGENRFSNATINCNVVINANESKKYSGMYTRLSGDPAIVNMSYTINNVKAYKIG